MKKWIHLFCIFLVLLLLPFGASSQAKSSQVTDLRWTARNDGDPPFIRIAME